MALSDVNNVLAERYAYDVFGRPTLRDVNGVQIDESGLGNPYLFTGRRYDVEAGLYYYRARYYDYYAGRFLQPDPLGYVDGLNMYAYVGNGPLSWADPYGLCKGDGFWGNLWKGKYVGTGYGEFALKAYAKGYVEAGGWGLSNWRNWGAKFGNATGMAFSSLWQEETWKETTVTLVSAYGVRNAGGTWPLADGSPAYTPVDYGNAFRVERHMLGKGASRGNLWHLDGLWGRIRHWPWKM